jgi:hypothetical protein
MTNEYIFQVDIISKYKDVKTSSVNLKALIADFDKVDKSQIEWRGWDYTLFPSFGQVLTSSQSEITESADIKHKVKMQLKASLVAGHYREPYLRSSSVVIHLEESEFCLQSAGAIKIELFNSDHQLVNELFVPREDLAKFILTQLPEQLLYLDKDENLHLDVQKAAQEEPLSTSAQHSKDKVSATIISQRHAQKVADIREKTMERHDRELFRL